MAVVTKGTLTRETIVMVDAAASVQTGSRPAPVEVHFTVITLHNKIYISVCDRYVLELLALSMMLVCKGAMSTVTRLCSINPFSHDDLRRALQEGGMPI